MEERVEMSISKAGQSAEVLIKVVTVVMSCSQVLWGLFRGKQMQIWMHMVKPQPA